MESDNITINIRTYSLHELMLSLQSVISRAYSSRQFWVRCEISRISPHKQSGHCYLELVDKNESSIVAQQRGIIWADQYFSICEKFRAITNSELANGMKVLFNCSVSFHPVHGLSLVITDIDPSFTLGEMARMKNESIQRLKSDGIFDLNRRLNLPILPQRIAVISVATSRGFQDFMTTLENHSRSYNIHCTLFEAILQGENAVPTLSAALKKISSAKNDFDAIAIIRGGVGDAGLSCYDDYSLSSLIARSPLPVITGIGHASNETVAEMIAFKNCITPTAAASFILEKFDIQFLLLKEQTNRMIEGVKDFCEVSKQNISLNAERFCLIVKNLINRREYGFRSLLAGLPAYLNSYFSSARQNISQLISGLQNVKKSGPQIEARNELKIVMNEFSQEIEEYLLRKKNDLVDTKNRLESVNKNLSRNRESLQHIIEKIEILDPKNILKRGYSITRIKGKALTKASIVNAGSTIETELVDGKIISIVETNNNYGKEENI